MSRAIGLELRDNHTCNCGACIEIPKLLAEGMDASMLLGHHTCTCQACIENLQRIVSEERVSVQTDHTCGCDACMANQETLYDALSSHV